MGICTWWPTERLEFMWKPLSGFEATFIGYGRVGCLHVRVFWIEVAKHGWEFEQVLGLLDCSGYGLLQAKNSNHSHPTSWTFSIYWSTCDCYCLLCTPRPNVSFATFPSPRYIHHSCLCKNFPLILETFFSEILLNFHISLSYNHARR